MSSIFDELHLRRRSKTTAAPPEHQRQHFEGGRLSIVSGFGQCAAGVLMPGEAVPEPSIAAPHPTLRDHRGFPRLAHRLALAGSDGSESVYGRIDAALALLLQALPTVVGDMSDTPCPIDLVLTLPENVLLETQLAVQQQLQEALKALNIWDDRVSQCHVYALDDITVLRPEAGSEGGMPYVLWCCIESMLEGARIEDLEAQLPKGQPLIPGEGAALVLFERVPAEQSPQLGQFWIESRMATEGTRSKALHQLFASVDDADPDQAADWCIMDMAAGRRMADLFEALHAVFPGHFAPLDNTIALDLYCGWPGRASLPLQLMYALGVASSEQAVLLPTLVEAQGARLTRMLPVDTVPAA